MKKGSKVGEGKERTQLGWVGGWASCQHPQKKNLEGWGLEVVTAGASALLSSSSPVEAALSTLCWPQDVPTTPLWPSPFFPFIFIYLLTFMKFPFHPIPIACVVLTTPPHPSHPAVCLSVTRKIKTASCRTYVWSMRRDGWGNGVLGVLGQGHFGLLWTRES